MCVAIPLFREGLDEEAFYAMNLVEVQPPSVLIPKTGIHTGFMKNNLQYQIRMLEIEGVDVGNWIEQVGVLRTRGFPKRPKVE